MEPYGLQVYLYLAGNKDGFNLELSQEAAENEVGIKKTSFHKYINKLIEKGYLVQRKEGSNIYDFYEKPQEKQIEGAEPPDEQNGSQDENSVEDLNSSDELLDLLCESEKSPSDQISSQRSKEINNNTNTSTHKAINKSDVFVF